ncbi:MAG: cadherin domain-containing protein [Thiolinea sp.]
MQAANIGSGLVVVQGDGSTLINGLHYGGNADGSVLREVTVRELGGSAVVITGTGVSSGNGVLILQSILDNNGHYGVLLENGAIRNQLIANLIGGNGWAGIANDAAADNTFSRNHIFNNGALGIDLGLDGVTANSATDTWLNYPEVSDGSTISSNGSTIVTYDFDLDVPANTDGYRVEFFMNTTLDDSGHGEGEVYIGSVDITHPGGGLLNFKGTFNADQPIPEDANIAVTLTEKTGVDTLGATSEFSGVRNGNLAVCTSLLTDPSAPLPTVSIDENAPVVTLLEAKDENGDPITYAISGGADGVAFVIKPTPPDSLFDCVTIEFITDDDVIGTRDLSVDANGQIRAATAPLPGDYENPLDMGGDNVYDLMITATDINGNQVTKALSVKVGDVNEPPLITSPAIVSVVERQDKVVLHVQAEDQDAGDSEGMGLFYSLSGGDDVRHFSIDPVTGELRFVEVPDYEHPRDSNADNRYQLNVRVSDDQGYASSQALTVIVKDDPDNNGIRVSVRALLQGPFNTASGLMTDSLRSKGILPVTQPYGVEPFGYPGTEAINLDLALVEGNDAMVDWVLLEVRDALDPTVVRAARAALIQRDGDLMDAATGSTVLVFDDLPSGQYVLSLRHRNHLGVMTALPITLPVDQVPLVDFSQTATAVSGQHARLEGRGSCLAVER